MTWQEFQLAKPRLPDHPTLEQWRETVRQTEELLAQVDEGDRGMAGVIMGDTLIQAGVFLGFIEPEGESLAQDLVGDDPIPDDARRFDEKGQPLSVPITPEPDKQA